MRRRAERELGTRQIYEEHGRRSFEQIERLIPGCFIVLYIVMFAAAVWSRGT
jgi:hypothetical protein